MFPLCSDCHFIMVKNTMAKKKKKYNGYFICTVTNDLGIWDIGFWMNAAIIF